MTKKEYYNRLIIKSGIYDCEDNERIFLCCDSKLTEIAYNNEANSYAPCYHIEDGLMLKADDILYEQDFDALYYAADESDKPESIEMFETPYDDEPQPFVKADWGNHDHYLRLESEHGINTSYYDFDSDVEIIEGVCYEATYGIPQDYPKTECQSFYKFVANDGRKFYIKEKSPFFMDEQDYTFELINEYEFCEYD